MAGSYIITGSPIFPGDSLRTAGGVIRILGDGQLKILDTDKTLDLRITLQGVEVIYRNIDFGEYGNANDQSFSLDVKIGISSDTEIYASGSFKSDSAHGGVHSAIYVSLPSVGIISGFNFGNPAELTIETRWSSAGSNTIIFNTLTADYHNAETP